MKRVIIWQALLAASLGTSTIFANEARIRLPERATVKGPRIFLGNIARIDATSPALTKRLDTVLVGLSPLPGSFRTLQRGEVAQALTLAGFAPGEFELSGAAAVELKRASQRVSDQAVSAALRGALSERLGIPAGQLTLTSLRFIDQPEVGGGAVGLQVDELSRASLNSPINARILVSLDGVPSVHLAVELVASLRSSIQATATTRTRRPRRLVRSGQPVQIALEGPGMRISATGKARASGGLGDEVAVENVISGNIIRCVVTGEGQVLVQWSPISGLKEVSIQ